MHAALNSTVSFLTSKSIIHNSLMKPKLTAKRVPAHRNCFIANSVACEVETVV